MVEVSLEVLDDLRVRVDLHVADTEEKVIEEEMAFKVGVVADSEGGPSKLSLELDGEVVATFEQTEQGREDFWNYMDTIRVAQATGAGLLEALQSMRVDKEESS